MPYVAGINRTVGSFASKQSKIHLGPHHSIDQVEFNDKTEFMT